MRTSKYFFLCVVLALHASAWSAIPPIWVGTWSASQQLPDQQNNLPSTDLTDETLRETVHVSCGGTILRVHVSNAFGTQALHLSSVHIAHPTATGTSTIDPTSDRELLFSGSPNVIVPSGAEYVSDAIAYPLAALSDLTVSMHVEAEPGQQTGHPGSRETIFYAHGDLTTAVDIPLAKKIDHWYMLSGVDVQAAASAYSIVALGDSITDGHGTTTNGNDRWTDVLAQRLQANAGTRAVGILNQGIGGNHLLTDGQGQNALARFDRDVLAQPGVRYLIVLEGINDLGGLELRAEATRQAHEELVHRMIGAYQQIIERAHTKGIKVYGATVMPDGGSDYYHPDAASEQDREKVNAWIREEGHFDAVIDFDKITADPANPQKLLPTFDSGDHLHPGPAGFRAMGEAIRTSLFQ